MLNGLVEGLIGVAGERAPAAPAEGGPIGERFVGDATVSADRFSESDDEALERWLWDI